MKWAVELGEYGIEYQPRTAIKSQVLADFVVEFTSAAHGLESEPSKNDRLEEPNGSDQSEEPKAQEPAQKDQLNESGANRASSSDTSAKEFEPT